MPGRGTEEQNTTGAVPLLSFCVFLLSAWARAAASRMCSNLPAWHLMSLLCAGLQEPELG